MSTGRKPTYTGHAGYTGYTVKNPQFSRRQSSGERFPTTNAAYGSYHRPTSSSLKTSWELSPVRHPLSNNIGLKAANKKTTPNTKDAVKTSVGINSSSASKVNKIITGQQTISGVTKPPITTNTKPSIGDHASKAVGYQATGYQATGVNSGTIGGCPPVAGNTKTTSQSTDVTTKAVNKEHHYNSKIDQGTHQDNKSVLPTNQKVTPLTTTIPTATTTTTTTAAVTKDASGSGESITFGRSQPITSSTSKGKHQEPATSNTRETLPDNKLTGGDHSSDRSFYNNSRFSPNTGYNAMNKSSGSSVGNGYGNYERYDTRDVRVPSYSKKQVVRGLSNLGNTCFYNAVMQNLTVLVILYEKLKMIANSSGTRSYTIPGGDMNAESLTVTVNTSSGLTSLTNKLYQFLNNYNTGNPNPSSLLDGIGYKNTRFRGRAQQDSHELFRTLLDGIRTEEAELIRKAIDQKLGGSMDGETKLMKKVYKRNITTKIDEVFGGKMCNIVICRKCKHISHITEPFLDLSLPIVDSQRGRSRQRRDDKLTTTFTGVCDLLTKQEAGDVPYPITCERSHDGVCSIENCLSDYTDIEVMDDDNMFICSECNRRHQEQGQHSTGKGGGAGDPILSPVSKLLLINKLPPVLVLHLKRFSIGYTVTKNSKHVKFSLNLNMRKYCTKQCEGGYEYRLKGVVSHSGSLNFGHYIAYVCNDNQWYYASDSHVNTTSTGSLLNCEAYMLFYERT